ncbi:MAG: hypothetical protein H7X74_05335 [Methyloceanibacter sp.]|nr:hypothetical protein [Methyloceanibacter sp.]
MPRMLPKFSFRLLPVLLTLGLSACADTLTSEETTSSTTLQRDYDKTLTKAEQKAVISDLQSATTKKQGAAAPDQTASTGAKPAEKQD